MIASPVIKFNIAVREAINHLVAAQVPILAAILAPLVSPVLFLVLIVVLIVEIIVPLGPVVAKSSMSMRKYTTMRTTAITKTTRGTRKRIS